MQLVFKRILNVRALALLPLFAALVVLFQNCGQVTLIGGSGVGQTDARREQEASGAVLKSDLIDDMRLEWDESVVRSQYASGYGAYRSVKWRSGVIPVKFSSAVTAEQRAKFFTACAAWTAVARVKCVNRTTQSNYLYVNKATPNACWTDVGAGINGGQRLFNFAQDWCWNHSGLMHEIGHVMGFMHEHQRPDRDTYVQILWSNIRTEFRYAYDKLTLSGTDVKSTYDFLSIMHYWDGSYANPGTQAMVARTPYTDYTSKMGRYGTLSTRDKAGAVKLYGAK